MKTLAAVAVLTLLASITLASLALAAPPEKRNEVYVGVGTGPMVFVLDDIGDTFWDAIWYGSGSYRSENSGGPQYMVGFQHRFNRWLGAGCSGTWARERSVEYRVGAGGDTKLHTTTRQMATLEVDGRMHWADWRWGNLYSGLGLGFALRNYDYTNEVSGYSATHDWTHAALNPTYLGARFGRDLGGYVELGGFHNSIVTGGLAYRF